MSAFDSSLSYDVFADYVRMKSRHWHDRNACCFVKEVIRTSRKRVKVIRKGELLWRAQLGNDWKSEISHVGFRDRVAIPHKASRMNPLPDRATEGRVNPKGIPCLYLSTELETAMSEVRPWIGSYLTLAQFRIADNLRLVNCSIDSRPSLIGPYAESQERERAVWKDINIGFSRPVSRSDDVADYAPTQVLADAFRVEGYDGVIYRSALGTGGLNVAVFNPKMAKVTARFLYTTSSVRFGFSKLLPPVKMHEDSGSKGRRPQ